MSRTLIDIQELSERLGRIAVGTLYNWVSQARRGYGPFVNGEGVLFRKIGRCLRFDWEAIDARSTMGSASKR
jgi:transposase-like protein